MTPNAVKLVQESWTQVEAAGPAAAALFHCNLLGSRPWLAAPYTGYVDERDAMVMRTFGRAVKGMDILEAHATLLLQIGRINAECGVQSHHYPYFEVALLQTLGQILGDTFTEPLKQAWTAVFGTMTRLMLAGASGEPAAAVTIRQHGTDRRHQRRPWVATVATTAVPGPTPIDACTVPQSPRSCRVRGWRATADIGF